MVKFRQIQLGPPSLFCIFPLSISGIEKDHILLTFCTFYREVNKYTDRYSDFCGSYFGVHKRRLHCSFDIGCSKKRKSQMNVKRS